MKMNKLSKIAVILALSLAAYGTIRPAEEALGQLIAYNPRAKQLFKKAAAIYLISQGLYALVEKAAEYSAPKLEVTFQRLKEEAAEKEQREYAKIQQEVLTALNEHFPAALQNLILEYDPESALAGKKTQMLSQAIPGHPVANRTAKLVRRGRRRHIHIPFKPQDQDKEIDLVITKFLTLGFLEQKIQKLLELTPAEQNIELVAEMLEGGYPIPVEYEIDPLIRKQLTDVADLALLGKEFSHIEVKKRVLEPGEEKEGF